MGDTPAPLVLYMEDEPVTAQVVQRSLAKVGFQVELAGNGEEGLAKLQYHDFTAALIDYRMPEMNGIEVIRRLAEWGMTLPCIMLTGSGDEVIAVEAMKLGVADYVVKDSEGGYLTLLPAILERAIRQHRLQEAKREWQEERERLIVELQRALADIKQLGGLLPICASCKKIRDDKGYWQQVEDYLQEHSEAEFSHSICPTCAEALYGQYLESDPPEAEANKES